MPSGTAAFPRRRAIAISRAKCRTVPRSEAFSRGAVAFWAASFLPGLLLRAFAVACAERGTLARPMALSRGAVAFWAASFFREPGLPLHAFGCARAEPGALARVVAPARCASALGAVSLFREPGLAIRGKAGRPLGPFAPRRPFALRPILTGAARSLAPLAGFETIGLPLLFGNQDRGRRAVDAQHAPGPRRSLFEMPLGPFRGGRLAAQIGGLRARGLKPPLLAQGLALHAELPGKPRPELILQDTRFHFLDCAGLQVAQHERPERNADQAVHGQPKVLHDAAHLAVLALADGERDPHIVALLAFELRLDGAVVHAARAQARSEPVEFRLLDFAIGAHAVTPEPARGRQFEMARKVAVIREEKKALGVEIEPADGNQARQFFRQRFEDCRPPFRVFVARDAALGLVIAPQARRLRLRKGLPVHENRVAGRHVESRAFDRGAVHRNAFFPNQDFGVAARAKPRSSNDFCDLLSASLAVFRYFIRCSHDLDERKGLTSGRCLVIRPRRRKIYAA